MFQSDAVGGGRALIPTTTQLPTPIDKPNNHFSVGQPDRSTRHGQSTQNRSVLAGRRRGSMSGMSITANSIAHVRLTVSDIEQSRRFYESVFNWPVLIEIPENADETTRQQLGFLFGGVIYDMGGALIGLRPVAVDRFHEDRAGLDHIAFRAVDKDELEAAALHLDELGIDHEPVKDIGPSYILEFRDPDNIALELTAPK
jgi:glyoxylase I family protein